MLYASISKELLNNEEVVKGKAEVVKKDETTEQPVRRVAAELKPKKKPKKVSKMKRINLQVTPEDYNQIKDIADFNGISISTLLRNSALGRGRILRKID